MNSVYRWIELCIEENMNHKILFITFSLVGLILGGQVFAQKAQVPANEAIETYLFNQEYQAYRCGRLNSENGVGRSWYKRFTLMHITDVHASYDILRQAFRLNRGDFDVICNTGDNANGCGEKDAPAIITTLDSISSVVKAANIHKTPYIDVKGNHDVTGIANADYFSRMCTTMQGFKDLTWGNAEENRAYGYMDIKSNNQMGAFRLIFLDPFDYKDGDYGEKYPFMSAVFSQKQIDWFIDALVDATQKGLHVITLMHYSFGDSPIFSEENACPDATYYQDAFMIPDIIDAIQNKTKLEAEYKDKAGIHNIRIKRDFTSLGDLKYVCHLFGHIHSKNSYQCKKSDGSKKYNMLMLGEMSLARGGTAVNMVHKVSYNPDYISFSALSIDTIEKRIYRTSYGLFLRYDGSNSQADRTTVFDYDFSKK